MVDEFGKGDCGENKARRASALTKEPIGADHSSANYISYTVNNSAKNISNYLTLDAKKAFDQLCQAFTEAPILQHFDSKQYIRIKTDAFGHAIDEVLNQLTNNLSQWYPIAYFSHKMIFAKIRYKTYDGELLVIVEAFKTWRH